MVHLDRSIKRVERKVIIIWVGIMLIEWGVLGVSRNSGQTETKEPLHVTQALSGS